MKIRDPDDEDDFRPLSDAELKRNWDAGQRERMQIMRRLIKLLRPLVKTDPLIPAICCHLGDDCEEYRLREPCLAFARMRLKAVLHRRGPDHRETRAAREYLEDVQRIFGARKPRRRH
jgi:hypothetical protein